MPQLFLHCKILKLATKCLLMHPTDLQKGGKFVIILNHPCFRIPRQSGWGIEEEKKLQYRRIDRYQTDMKIPIQANPSKGNSSESTWSFHHPLSTYSKWIKSAGFQIESIDEWCLIKPVPEKMPKWKIAAAKNSPYSWQSLALKANHFSKAPMLTRISTTLL